MLMMLRQGGCVFWPFPAEFAHLGGVEAMAQDKHSTLDDLARRLRDLMRDLESAFNPQKPRRAPVPVPVPVRPSQPQRRAPHR